MCQLDWSMECWDIGSNNILGVSMRMFLDEINIWIDRLSKVDGPPQCGWDSDQLKIWTELKDWVGFLCAMQLEVNVSLLSSDWNVSHPLPWFSCFWTWTRMYTIDSLGFKVFGHGLERYHQLSWSPACQLQILGLLSFHNHVSQFFVIINVFVYLLHIYLYLYKNTFSWFCFSGAT